MANSFVNNKKVQLVAAAVVDNMDYIKASVSKMSESDMANKKFGRSYDIYLPDPGKVIQGLKADPDSIDEVPVTMYLDNYNQSVTIDAWEEKTDIEDFAAEVAKPRGVALARQTQKSIVEGNIFKSFQAVVKTGAPGFDLLSDASELLEDLSVASNLVTFEKPSVLGKIASSNVGKFFKDSTAEKLYTKAYIGEFANASTVGLAVVPTIKTGANIPAPGINFESAGENSWTADKVTGTGLYAGLAYKIKDQNDNYVKIVDASGIETENDLVVILTPVFESFSDRDGGKKVVTKIGIPQIRIAKQGTLEGNPNAWCDKDATSFTAEAILSANSTYVVGQCRAEDNLAFDGYKFKNLPGSENEAVATVGGVTVKMSMYGDGDYLEKLIRLDLPFAAGLMDPRFSVTTYLKL